MSHSKPLLIPWLRSQINSKKYPGVTWTNPEQTTFSIPWKNALRQDFSSADVLIFRAWAEVSGNGKVNGDASVWKRNFRSALRAKGFKLLSDNKNDPANPHKVFQWPDESTFGVPKAHPSSGSQTSMDPDLFEGCSFSAQDSQAAQCFEDMCLSEDTIFAESTPDQDILQKCLKGLNINPETEGITGFEHFPEQQQLQNHVVIGGQALPEQQQYPVAFEDAVGGAGLPEQPAHPMDGVVGGACDAQLVDQFLQTMSKAKDENHFKTQFRISVYYRGVKVSEQLIENEGGIRLVFRPELNGPVFDHESGLSLVSLPSPGAMVDQTQASLTGRILEKMGEGLDVGVSGHLVYGQRRGEIKAFWSFSKFDQSRQPKEVSKLKPDVLYMFKDFVRGILGFIDGKECPPCSLFLCLGEKWPDPEGRSWEKKLITVEVVLTSMELVKSLAVGGGASSLQSVELQMSLEEMMEMY
ncbi:interferon regulatory factor 3 [Thalassophryne amazonica]|uniref:interferon regulatory factor 3 n=1 Tax=Thalassophryne amazonica TaxID=390379 RepID=UPI001471B5F2|nr:interferon regulatory factor 3 [Thalassophryne amazonica]XP_034049030.1 interferon regulatory factor 3 [Thalassophryne amazonica]